MYQILHCKRIKQCHGENKWKGECQFGEGRVAG